MDERKIKRLVVMVGVSIIVIMVFKSMMLKTAVSINKAAMEKNQTPVTAPVSSPEEAMPASAVEPVVSWQPAGDFAASGVSEVGSASAVSSAQQ